MTRLALTIISVIGSYSRGGFLALSVTAFVFWVRSSGKMITMALLLACFIPAVSLMPDAWKERIVQPSLMKRLSGSLDAVGGVDRISVEAAADLPYAIPNIRVEYTEADPGIPFGFWRSVGASVNGYVTEAFIDEMATTAGKDPYQFRRDLLKNQPRHLAVLDLVAEKSGWKTPAPSGRSRGSPTTKSCVPRSNF